MSTQPRVAQLQTIPGTPVPPRDGEVPFIREARMAEPSYYPEVEGPSRVGEFSPLAGAGSGYVWDAVLEYRVWCHPEGCAPDLEGGSDYYHSFATYAEAHAFSQSTRGTEDPLALIRQDEYISEPDPGTFNHMKEVRFTEWPVEFLMRPRRTPRTIPDFLAPDAPRNRLDILRGKAR